MKKIKDVILENALNLFNKEGYLNVSIRQIAAETGISHSNLIYHYKTKQDIAAALHDQILEHAKRIHAEIHEDLNFMDALYQSTQKGFTILYNYRFFMIDLKYILAENDALKQLYLQVGELRKDMYKSVINTAIAQGYFRDELYPNEYDYFIEHIKIYSDSWITSSSIYDTGTPQDIIAKYSELFIRMFYLYCTEKGRACFSEQLQK
jgi:AcrR family transcriptional regulator